MKIELNPSRMTIAELNDCIAELSAQRDRLLDEEKQAIEIQCRNAFLAAFGQVWDYTETGHYNIFLNIKSVNGRRHIIPLNMEKIEEWDLGITRAAEQ